MHLCDTTPQLSISLTHRLPNVWRRACFMLCAMCWRYVFGLFVHTIIPYRWSGPSNKHVYVLLLLVLVYFRVGSMFIAKSTVAYVSLASGNGETEKSNYLGFICT